MLIQFKTNYVLKLVMLENCSSHSIHRHFPSENNERIDKAGLQSLVVSILFEITSFSSVLTPFMLELLL